MAVAPVRQYENHLHLTPDTTTTPHHAIFTGQMLFLMPNQQCHSTEGNWQTWGSQILHAPLKGKGSLYSITQRRVPELIPVLGSQPVGDASHKPGGRRPLLSARPAVTLATLTSAATNFAAWWTEARWVRTVWIRLLPENVAAWFEPRPFCAWVQHANHSATEPLMHHHPFLK